MKRFYWIILCLVLCIQTVQGALPEETADALPPEVEALLREVDTDSHGIPDLGEGLGRLWQQGCETAISLMRAEVSGLVLLLGVVLLCALAEDCLLAVGETEETNITVLAGGAAVVLISVGDLHSLLGLGWETVEELNVLSKALLPTLTAAVAAGGGVVSAGVHHVAAVFFSDILMTLVRDTLLPMVYLYAAAAAADLLVPGKRLQVVAKFIKKGTIWLLTGLLTLYTGYLTLSGVAAGSADSLTGQAVRTAIGVVPVVGKIISDAAGAVLSGAGVLKNALGISGMLAVLAVCLTPFLRLAVQYLLYKLAAFFAGTVGSPKLMELIDALGGAFGLVLGMTGACALVLMISMMSCVMVVTA